jgi:hypothetical protein
MTLFLATISFPLFYGLLYEKTSYVGNHVIDQSYVEDVLDAGMLVADVLLFADDCI